MGRTSAPASAGSARADHPHAGGENQSARIAEHPAIGPSPRGWGEPVDVTPCPVDERTIPTRVGRTGAFCNRLAMRSDHPHAGGENFSQGFSRFSPSGPSPRGWGERPRQSSRAAASRTIPTRVGRTVAVAWVPPSAPDHPHAGGENRRTHGAGAGRVGPSPRGWGEPIRIHREPERGRTIPTRVGRTAGAPGICTPGRDHPHAGGENFCPSSRSIEHMGPSPRGWGEP